MFLTQCCVFRTGFSNILAYFGVYMRLYRNLEIQDGGFKLASGEIVT